jgi:DNA-directed RNA polymerase subunit F
MNDKEIRSEEPVTIAEVKKILSDIAKDKKELSETNELEYVQKKALEHAQHASKISLKDATAIVNDLTGMGLQKEKAIEITNCMPANRDELRAFFSKERKQPETEEIDKVLEVLAKYK